MIAAARRLIRAVRILANDGRIPKPLRGLAAFGVLPIPGPFDEAVLLIVGLLLSKNPSPSRTTGTGSSFARK